MGGSSRAERQPTLKNQKKRIALAIRNEPLNIVKGPHKDHMEQVA